MNEDFLAVIKLISGEEILSKVCPLEDEDDTLVLDCPVQMSSEKSKAMGINVVRVEPWIKTGTESIYLLRMSKIVTISEVFDQKVHRIYSRFVQSYFFNGCEDSENKMTKEMGYLTSVKEARSSLEKIFNNS
jgi:hypothetical protein